MTFNCSPKSKYMREMYRQVCVCGWLSLRVGCQSALVSDIIVVFSITQFCNNKCEDIVLSMLHSHSWKLLLKKINTLKQPLRIIVRGNTYPDLRIV